jgi:hypothetical protein
MGIDGSRALLLCSASRCRCRVLDGSQRHQWAAQARACLYPRSTHVKLYYHPVLTTSRPIMLLAADDKIAMDYELIDLLTGAHLEPRFTDVNPSQQVPVLEDGDFRLTESSAILKYLADKTSSPTYPKDLRQRARVNERMDWFNTGFYRELGYGVIYPQIIVPSGSRPGCPRNSCCVTPITPRKSCCYSKPKT